MTKYSKKTHQWTKATEIYRFIFIYQCKQCCHQFLYRFMVFNAIFNNISVISWQSVLLV